MPARPLAALPSSSWARNPGYEIDLAPLPTRVRALFGGATVVDSVRALVMFELGHAPVYYFPRADVALDLLRPTDHASHCPYKGDASYWTLAVADREAENAAWSYRDPYPEMAALKDLIGLYWERMDAWYHGDAVTQAPVEIAGRVDQAASFARAYPALAAEWDRERNQRIQPYEFAATSTTPVWWRDGTGESWRESIRDRVLRAALG